MAVPTITTTYPTDSDTGIPIGATIYIDFSNGIDIATAKQYVVVYGADSDLTSGPDSALWLDQDTGNNPYYLTSPGFKGVLDASYELVYLDSGGDEIAAPALADEAAELAGSYTHRLKITPKSGPLAANTTYTMHILGDTEATTTVGISSRTVWDTVADGGNAAATGTCVAYGDGTYAGGADTIYVEITTSGDIGTAKYKWYYVSEGSGSAVLARVTNRRFRTLDADEGFQLRFTGSGFVSGDIYRVNIEPVERLATTSQLSFTTGDGTYTAAPSSPSTPATSTPPASAIPGSSTADPLYVVSMTPADRSFNQDVNTRQIVITFSGTLDAATVTDASVTLTAYPALGGYDSQKERELNKKLTVSGTTLTIDY